MDTTARFWDRIADRYSRQPVRDEAAYQRKLAITREYLRPDMEVLELGCGTGSTALVHAPYVKHVRAVDVSRRMVEIARGKAAAAGVDNVDFEQAAIDELSVADASVDVVLALSILHLVPDRDAVIRDVRRMLRPGGLFVSSTACMGGTLMAPIARLVSLGSLVGLLPRVAVFSRDALLESIRRADFRIEHDWQPGRNKAVFVVARKPGGSAARGA